MTEKTTFIISLSMIGKKKKSAEIVLFEVASGQTGKNKVINKTLYEFMKSTHWKMTVFHSRTFLVGSLQGKIFDFRRL